MVTGAQELGKMTKNEARADKDRWIKGRLEEKLWGPAKEVTKKPPPGRGV